MTARASTRCASVASASSSAARATSGSAWIAGVDDRARVAGRVLEPHGSLPEGEEHDLRERRQPVDRPVGVGDPADLVDRPVDGGRDLGA